MPSALSGSPICCSRVRPALAGRRTEVSKAAATFLRRHREVVRAAGAGGPTAESSSRLDAAARERDLCTAVGLLDHLEPRASDRIVSRGERMSGQILTAALARAGRRPSMSTRSRWSPPTSTMAPPHRTRPKRPGARAGAAPRLAAGTIVVVPGFIGRAPDGSVTTMGRGGTDLSATLLARALGAKRVVVEGRPGISPPTRAWFPTRA